LHMVVAFGVGAGNLREQAIEGITFLIERGCDGLIVMSNALLDSDIEALGPKQSRLVVLNHCYESIAEQCFTVDHVYGGRLAAQALLKFKHTKIAVISGPSTAHDNVERIKGFMSELAVAGIADSSIWTTESNFAPDGGWTAAEQLLASGFHLRPYFVPTMKWQSELYRISSMPVFQCQIRSP